MIPARINLVTLGVSDVARSTALYERLGWKKSSASQDESVSFFRMAGTKLALFGKADLAEDAKLALGSDGGPRVSLAINLASEGEVDAAFEAFVAAGATATKRPEKVFWGGYSGYVSDPDGHLWELAFNPVMALDDSGEMVLPD